MAFLSSFALTAFFGIFGLFALDRFGFGTREVGLIMMVVGAVMALAQGGLTGPLTRCWGESFLIKSSLLLTAVGFLLIVMVRHFYGMVFATGFFTLASALLSPAVMSLTSQKTTMEQGLTMGLSNSYISLGRIAGPVLSGFLFDVNPIYPFIFGAIVMVIGFVVGLISLKPNRPIIT